MEKIIGTYRSLQALGFHAPQIEAALLLLPLAGVSQDAALDWLLLHLGPGELPRRFAGQARRAGGEVDVRLRAAEWPAPAAEPALAGPAQPSQEQQRQAAEEKRQAEEEARQKQVGGPGGSLGAALEGSVCLAVRCNVGVWPSKFLLFGGQSPVTGQNPVQ